MRDLGKRSQMQGNSFRNGGNHMLRMDHRRTEEGKLGGLRIGETVDHSGAGNIMYIGSGDHQFRVPEGDRRCTQMISHQSRGVLGIPIVWSSFTLAEFTGKQNGIARLERKFL